MCRNGTPIWLIMFMKPRRVRHCPELRREYRASSGLCAREQMPRAMPEEPGVKADSHRQLMAPERRQVKKIRYYLLEPFENGSLFHPAPPPNHP